MGLVGKHENGLIRLYINQQNKTNHLSFLNFWFTFDPLVLSHIDQYYDGSWSTK